MNPKPSMSNYMLQFGSPIVVVVLLYIVAFSVPLRRTLTEQIAKQVKLEQIVSRRAPEHPALLLRLSEHQSEHRSLLGELESTKQSGAHLVAIRADRKEQLFSTTSPAGRLAQTLQLLSRHGLKCLDSSLVARATKQQGESLDALKPVADLLGVVAGEESGRRQIRLTLSGRFQDLQNAVRELHSEHSGAFIVSLEMEPADAGAGQQLWILTISV